MWARMNFIIIIVRVWELLVVKLFIARLLLFAYEIVQVSALVQLLYLHLVQQQLQPWHLVDILCINFASLSQIFIVI